MIDWINRNRDGHIITIEDPIEYYHEHKNCIMTQREVGNDVTSFADAIRGALRQDPDVILVGEMRDLRRLRRRLVPLRPGTWCLPRCTPPVLRAPSTVSWMPSRRT